MEDLSTLEQQAIDAAINTNWQEAAALNKKIIKIDKKNIDAYLRLGYANLQIGDISEAKKWYKKTLKLQPGNSAAIENLERIKILGTKHIKTTAVKTLTLNPDMFLEVPGKTKAVTLVNLGQKNILAQLSIGQEVYLLPKKRRIEIRTIDKHYVGCLPDDISKRLIIFMKAGSEFATYIKEASLNNVVIFLREVKKGKRVIKYVSFPTNIQSNLGAMSQEEEGVEGAESEDLTDSDLDKLAEELSEEKEYLPYTPEEAEEEPEE